MLIPIHRKRDLFALIEICSSSIGVEHFVLIMKDKPACDHVDSHRRGINMTAVQNVNHLHIPTADQVRETKQEWLLQGLSRGWRSVAPGARAQDIPFI